MSNVIGKPSITEEALVDFILQGVFGSSDNKSSVNNLRHGAFDISIKCARIMLNPTTIMKNHVIR
jgi:hypothetical protein